jgi:hypothetical protein
MNIIYYILLILRSAIYLWVGVEAFFLHYLYNYGYEKFKPTPIIRMLQLFFFFLGAFFVIIAFIPLFSHKSNLIIEDLIVRNISAIVAIFVGIYLTKFREASLENSPKGNKKNETIFTK